MHRYGRLWIGIAALWLAAGCGYTFVGANRLPAGAKSIHVAVFENNSMETGIETVFSNDFIYELTRSSPLIVKRTPDADLVLSGKIVSITADTISRATTQTVSQRRVSAVLKLTLKDAKGNTVWANNSVGEDEAYTVLPDVTATAHSRRAAIQRLSRRLAQKTLYQLNQIF